MTSAWVVWPAATSVEVVVVLAVEAVVSVETGGFAAAALLSTVAVVLGWLFTSVDVVPVDVDALAVPLAAGSELTGAEVLAEAEAD